MRTIPFAVVAPATILFFGSVVTVVTIVMGLSELEEHAREVAHTRAALIGKSLGQRLQQTPEAAQPAFLRQASDECACALAIVLPTGVVLASAPPEPWLQHRAAHLARNPKQHPDGLALHVMAIAPGGARRAAQLLTLVGVESVAEEKAALVSSVATFALLLLALSVSVGWALARDVHGDVLFVRDRILGMAQGSERPKLEVIPVRTIDQVGLLTASFNTLLQRFAAAERAYRHDLSQAKDFDQDRAAFLRALSHELRTPLNAILGFTDVLLDEIDGPLSEDVRENLTVVRTSGEHLRALIDDILALSALESGEFRLSREQLDLYSVASDVVTEARVAAKQKGIELHLELVGEEGSTVAYADRRRMRQVLGNVMANAVKFTNQGSVTVSLEKRGASVELRVADTGPGIAEEQLEAIFEEFQQTESSRALRSGTGLGLSITRRLVQLHGGSVRAESEVGRGSTFIIHLPVEERSTQVSLPEIMKRVSEPVIREG